MSSLSVVSKRTHEFLLRPSRSPFKKLFQGTRLGEVLQAMSLAKSVPEGLKCQECERGVGGNKSPIRYIPESDPIQEALEKKKKTTYFKLTLPSTGSKLSVAQWTSGTPEQFLLHVRAVIHACKQMELDMNFSSAQEAVATEELNLDITKEAYMQVHSSEKKKAKGTREKPRRPMPNHWHLPNRYVGFYWDTTCL